MDYASEKEMIEHCDKFACIECPISERCEFFHKTTKFLIDPMGGIYE